MNREENINLVKIALEIIRPYLQQDGGDIEFIELTEHNVVKFKLRDSCQNCKFKEQTLFIVEKYIRKHFPDLKSIEEID